MFAPATATERAAIVATLLELAGASAIGVGLWLIYPPAAWLWAGVAAFGAAYALEVWRTPTVRRRTGSGQAAPEEPTDAWRAPSREGVRYHQGDVREVLPTLDAGSVQCVVTSPPYWGLRDYGVDNQIGLEPTPDAYVQTLVAVFREVRRVLRDDGTVWLNLGDSYANKGVRNIQTVGGFTGERIRKRAAGLSPNDSCQDSRPREIPPGLKPKDLVGIPWRVALALQADGWYLRSDIIWAKGISFCPSYSGSVMPESVTDRPTSGHEHVSLLTKSARYYYDAEAVREAWADGREGDPGKATTGITDRRASGSRRYLNVDSKPQTSGRNLRNVWAINPQPFSDAHFATFPMALVEPCVKAGTSQKGQCAACGAPLVRVVEREKFGKAPSSTKFDSTMQGGPLSHSRQAYRAAGLEGPPQAQTTGWHPSCGCNADTAPQTVLDPFAGSGTVGCVALKLGREFVGIELNPAYCTMARESIMGPLYTCQPAVSEGRV